MIQMGRWQKDIWNRNSERRPDNCCMWAPRRRDRSWRCVMRMCTRTRTRTPWESRHDSTSISHRNSCLCSVCIAFCCCFLSALYWASYRMNEWMNEWARLKSERSGVLHVAITDLNRTTLLKTKTFLTTTITRGLCGLHELIFSRFILKLKCTT